MMMHNQVAMERLMASTSLKVRPCIKSHKCPWITETVQLPSNITRGICCATVGEMDSMLRNTRGRDVLLANVIVSNSKIHQVVQLCKEFGPDSGDCTVINTGENSLRVVVCTDSDGACDSFSSIAGKDGVTVGCLIEINVGQLRCGVDTPEEVLTLAKHIDSLPNLKFLGIQGYNGAIQHVRGRAERRELCESVAGVLREAKDLLAQNGFTCEIVSGGGTDSFGFD